MENFKAFRQNAQASMSEASSSMELNNQAFGENSQTVSLMAISEAQQSATLAGPGSAITYDADEASATQDPRTTADGTGSSPNREGH